MPLPTHPNAATQAELIKLYDRYAEIAYTEMLRKAVSDSGSPVAAALAHVAYRYADAMMNERNK